VLTDWVGREPRLEQPRMGELFRFSVASANTGR
jgi:hypothetical protein